MNYIGTMRARAGSAWDRFLLYGTGGFAYSQVNFSASAAVGAGGGGVAISTSQNDRTRAGRLAAALNMPSPIILR